MVPTSQLTLLSILLLFPAQTRGQQRFDSIPAKELNEVVIQSQRLIDIERLPALQGTRLWTGRKNEVVRVQTLDANLTERVPRQLFAKVPGVFVYDMDGAGNQMNISTRGLDPHRGWEFNIRKNGVITNSDLYGYPASHYSMPMEAVERIELVRGTGSLQYGAQFGGMLNYVSKGPDTTRSVTVESVNAMGSFGTLSTFNAAGGKVGKFTYYAYFNKRVSDGYRDNSSTDFDAASVFIAYGVTKNLTLKTELARSSYVYQIPGPLTDSMFMADPRQSTRARNYFNPEIYVPSVSMDWQLSKATRVSWVTSAVLGARNSVQFDRPATIADDINPITLTYAPRQVDIDQYNSYTTELSVLHMYHIGPVSSVMSGGIQLIRNDLHRQQLGKGTTGADFDLTLSEPGWGRDLHFDTRNVAVYIENAFHLFRNLTVTPGFRIESGRSEMSGTIVNYDPGELPNTIAHQFPLLGMSAEYRLGKQSNLYAGWSQAYRPVLFKDIIPTSVYERADKKLKDAFGYNLEAGYRGHAGGLRWDVSLFRLEYKNRMGTLSETDPVDGSFYIFRTNIGDSNTNGAELFAEYTRAVSRKMTLTVFTSTSFFDAQFVQAQVRSGDVNVDVSGNRVEAVPEWISRNGATIRLGESSISFLYSYTGENYADALNTVEPSPTGSVGLVPSYGILDINSSVRASRNVFIRFNIGNITNRQYFTKRPTFYPGPGVWSSDGRSFNLSIGITI